VLLLTFCVFWVEVRIPSLAHVWMTDNAISEMCLTKALVRRVQKLGVYDMILSLQLSLPDGLTYKVCTTAGTFALRSAKVLSNFIPMKKGTEYLGFSLAVSTRCVVAGHNPPVIGSNPAAILTTNVQRTYRTWSPASQGLPQRGEGSDARAV
jgi:hypothetical protein